MGRQFLKAGSADGSQEVHLPTPIAREQVPIDRRRELRVVVAELVLHEVRSGALGASRVLLGGRRGAAGYRVFISL